MKAKKLAAVVLTAATASSMLVGGSASVFAASSATEPAADLNQGDASTAKIVIWSPTDEQGIENWWAEKITAWNQEHPDLTIARQAIDRSDSYAYENKITTATTSNDLPDILFVDGPTVSYYAANGTIIPIDDVYTDEDKKDFMPSSIQQNTYDDHLYAIGPTESSVALYYRKS